MDIWDIFTILWSLATFRNVLLAILTLPLLTMVVLLPGHQHFSKDTKEWIAIFGVFGYLANGVLAVESALRTIGEVVYYFTQKPSLYFDSKAERMVSKYDSFDSSWLSYLIVLVVIAVLSAIFTDYYNPSKNGGGKRNRDSEINSLNL